MMNKYEEELRSKWNKINYQEGGALKLAVLHPLEWYVRYATRDQKSIVIVSDTPADKLQSSKSIEASCNLRKDGRYAVSFTLVNREQEDVFITMSSDIIEFSRNEQQPKESLKRILRRYAAWIKLFDHKRNALLSSNAQKGLLAELFFMKENIERGVRPSDAIDGWVGPDGADQDFVYKDGWYEIKATGASSSHITISSIEQLDNPGNGELVVFRIDECAPAHLGAVTLYKIVHTLFEMMSLEPNTLDDFVLKLGSVGYIDMDEYDKQNFVISSKQSYLVNDVFPRIERSGLRTEIINAEYQLDLPSLNPWAIKKRELWMQSSSRKIFCKA